MPTTFTNSGDAYVFKDRTGAGRALVAARDFGPQVRASTAAVS